MTRLRLLHLVANRWWTGSGDPALDLAVALRDRGHDVRFACIRGDALDERARQAGLPPVRSLSLERTARPWTLLADVRALERLVRDHGVEIVHAHQSHDHWLAAAALRGRPARLVRTVHHRRALHRGPALRWLVSRTDAVIAASQAIAALARARGVPAGRLAVVGGGIPAQRFSPDTDGRVIRAELGLGSAPVIGCVARLVPGRGHDVLLQAAARLRARIPHVRVLLVGRGEGRPAIDRLVRELALDAVVVFAGYRGEDLPQALAAVDCFVFLGSGSEESCRAVLGPWRWRVPLSRHASGPSPRP
jgi:glycosyltransferase involved in cell wall biosynthesis